jgi:hypothetical protein
MSIFESVVKTQSYVVFLKMSGMTASLFFGYLETRKLDFASAAGTAGGGCTLLHGFTSFVSSEGHAFSISKTGVPFSYVIVRGLQCLVRFAHACWEMMGPIKPAQAFLLQEDHTYKNDVSHGVTQTKPRIDYGEGAAGQQHGLCEEEVQLRVQVRNSVDEVVVRMRPEKVDLTGHRGLVELPEEMRRCTVRVRELVVASSELETLPEWLGELARLEVLRLGHATLEEVCVGYRSEKKREGCDGLTTLPDGIRVLTALKTLDLSG